MCPLVPLVEFCQFSHSFSAFLHLFDNFAHFFPVVGLIGSNQLVQQTFLLRWLNNGLCILLWLIGRRFFPGLFGGK
jgi:hypothetical protein